MSSQSQQAAVALIAKLQAQGYTRTDHGSAALMHSRKFVWTRISTVDTVVGIAYDDGVVTAESFWAHEANVKAGAKDLKSFWPLGLGGSIEQFPVLFAANADQGAIAAAQSSAPKRFCILSAHALVHGPTSTVVLFEGRAIWGAAYIKSMRKKLQGLLT